MGREHGGPAILRRIRITLSLATLILLAQIVNGGVATAQSSELDVQAQSVSIDFPESMTFHLQADAPEPITEVELRYRPEHDDVTHAERPAFEQGDRSVDIDHQLDTRIQYLPPGIDLNYRWVITLEDGRQLETEPRQVFYIDNRYDWQEASNGMVSVYHYAGDSSFGELAVDVMSRTMERFGEDFNVQLEEPIRAVLYGNTREFQDALPYRSPEWIGGFAEPEMNLVVAGVRPGDGAATEMQRMLTHEAVHLLVHQATMNPFNSAPRWLDEGVANNYQEVDEPRFDEILDQAIDQGRLIPVRALRSSFPSDPDLALQSYAQSESIVRFLIEEHGHESIARLFEAYRSGVSHAEATEVALGMTLDELDAAWKAWLGYPGDQGAAPATPGTLDRIEDFLATAGIVPLLVIGGLVAFITGLTKMIRAYTNRDLDDDVSPEVEYYGQSSGPDQPHDDVSDQPWQP